MSAKDPSTTKGECMRAMCKFEVDPEGTELSLAANRQFFLADLVACIAGASLASAFMFTLVTSRIAEIYFSVRQFCAVPIVGILVANSFLMHHPSFELDGWADAHGGA